MAIMPAEAGDEGNEAFFLPTDDPEVFIATPLTEGLWTPQTQHAGPPSALITRAVERTESSIPGPSHLTRLAVEILGPLPTGEVRVSAAVVRPGRTVELVESELIAGGRPAMRARAWRMRTAAVALPEIAQDAHPAPPPIPEAASRFSDPVWTTAYLGAVEWRFVSGHFERPGPSEVWARLRVPLVAGEVPTPTQQLVAISDSGNGLSSVLPFESWWFINTDLCLHLHRLPESEWIFVRARQTLDPCGVGMAETELYDRSGRLGRGAQSLLVGPR